MLDAPEACSAEHFNSSVVMWRESDGSEFTLQATVSQHKLKLEILNSISQLSSKAEQMATLIGNERGHVSQRQHVSNHKRRPPPRVRFTADDRYRRHALTGK